MKPIPSTDGSPPCYHGGAFFTAIGDEFDSLGRRLAARR